jgi:hypothetical protein
MQLTLNETTVSAYANTPHMKIDFGSVMYQSPWWQVNGAGVMAGNIISNRIPMTCVGPGCTPAMITEKLGVGESSDGVDWGKVVANNSGCVLGTDCWYTDPRNLYKTGVGGTGDNNSYTSLYNKLYIEAGVGKTYPAGTDLNTIATDPGVKVAFVKGNLVITQDNTVSVGQFLMVGVSGSVTISSTVNQVEGVLISEGNININDTSDTMLNINGTIYTNSTVAIHRGYAAMLGNNTNPAVKFNYRPDLLFNMPAAVSKVLSKWRVGQ